MKKRIVLGFVALVFGLLTTQAWAHGMGGFGSFGGFHGSFGHPGFHGFGGHSSFVFGFHSGFPRQRSEFFFGFGPPFFVGSPFVHRGPFFRHPFVPVGPPSVVIISPFFCFPHRLGFAEQALFFDHLHHFHGIPLRSPLSFCTPLAGGRFIFFGF